MIKGGIMKLLVVVMLLVRGSFSCWSSSDDHDEDNSASVVSTMTPPLYNCTFEYISSNSSVATVRNITNTTEILCQAFVDVSEHLEYPTISGTDKIMFCNHLGDTVCPNCTNDTSYKDFVYNIRTSCAKDETTTISATTAVFSTQPGNETTTISATTAVFSTQPGNETTTISATTAVFSTQPGTTEATKTEQNSTTTTIIIAVVAGIVILVLLVVVIFFICTRKRTPKESKAKIQNGPNDQVVRLETNETGEFYAVLNREKNGARVVTNGGPLYDEPHDVKVIENAELYTEVSKNGSRNGASDKKKKKQDGQRQRNTNDDVVYDSRPEQQKDGETGDGQDTQLYNVLHQPASVRENDVLYSALNAER